MSQTKRHFSKQVVIFSSAMCGKLLVQLITSSVCKQLTCAFRFTDVKLEEHYSKKAKIKKSLSIFVEYAPAPLLFVWGILVRHACSCPKEILCS